MVDLCPVVKWWSENETEKSLFMVQNVWKSRHFTIWILDTHTVRYSDESGTQMGLHTLQIFTTTLGILIANIPVLTSLYLNGGKLSTI